MLQGDSRFTFVMPRAWTDLADPAIPAAQAGVLDLKSLLGLTQLVEQIRNASENNLTPAEDIL